MPSYFYGAIMPLSKITKEIRHRLTVEMAQIDNKLLELMRKKNGISAPPLNSIWTEHFVNPYNGKERKATITVDIPTNSETYGRIMTEITLDWNDTHLFNDAIRNCLFINPIGTEGVAIHGDDWEWEETPKPWKLITKTCTCGAHKTYGKECPLEWHFRWCDLREGQCLTNQTNTFLR